MVIAHTVNMLHAILAQARGVDECELLYTKSASALTRFTANRIHQGTDTYGRSLRVRAIVDGRQGVYETDRFDQDSISAAIQRAGDIARLLPASRRPAALPASLPVADSVAYHESTARALAYDRAHLVREMVDLATPRGVEVSGAISTSEETICVVNTRGTESYQQYTRAELNLVASRGTQNGYGYWIGSDLSAMPHRELAGEAIAHAACDLPEIVLEPGERTVVLDHYAVGAMIGTLAAVGFGAKQYVEGRSFLSGKLGKRICGPRITITDDGRNPDGMPRLFDCEGVPRKRVLLVEAGIARGVVTDSFTAPLAECLNTGHALPMPNPDGPAAMNLFVAPGRQPLARMLAGVRDGIYVRKFHYVNVVDPMTSVITGMTKDGTFLIENGRITRPVRNLRFTQNVLRALKSVAAVSAESRLVEGVYGPVHAPAMLIRRFRFTGVSDQ